jgi:IS30 family transposase
MTLRADLLRPSSRELLRTSAYDANLAHAQCKARRLLPRGLPKLHAVLNREPAAMRKTMIYDQGREMHGHKILTERTGDQIWFADPHNPCQRGSNENTNGLLRQYMPKVSDLLIYSQDPLDAIALSLNTRPRARLEYEAPLVVSTQHIALLQHPTDTVN